MGDASARLRSTILLSVLLLSTANAWQNKPDGRQEDTTNAECIERVQISPYPQLARQARIAGTLLVTVKLGQNGTVQDIAAESHLNHDMAKGLLLKFIEPVLRKAQFRRDCAG